MQTKSNISKQILEYIPIHCKIAILQLYTLFTCSSLRIIVTHNSSLISQCLHNQQVVTGIVTTISLLKARKGRGRQMKPTENECEPWPSRPIGGMTRYRSSLPNTKLTKNKIQLILIRNLPGDGA